MSRPRSTFSKRNRETKLKDKARAKDERRAMRTASTSKGPQIAWDEAVVVIDSSLDVPPSPAPPTSGGEPQKREP